MDYLLILLGVIMASFGAIILKLGAGEVNYDQSLVKVLISVFLSWKILLGLLFYFVPALFWIYLLKKMEISFLQPFFALAYVFTPILAIVILNEKISVLRWLGVLVILLGVILVSRS